MGANAQTTVPTFVAAQVLTAQQLNNSARTGVPVFADATARDAAFGGTGEKTLAEGQLAYLEDLNVVQYYDGAAWATVGPTTSGVVQVKSTTKLDTFTTSSTSFTDLTGLSVSITPTSASNKVLVVCNLAIMGQSGTTRGTAQLVRDSTAIGSGTTAGSRISGIAVGNSLGGGSIISNAIIFLDSPATIGATTYKIQVRSNSAGTTYVNRGEEDTDNAGFSRVSSTITVFEVTP